MSEQNTVTLPELQGLLLSEMKKHLLGEETTSKAADVTSYYKTLFKGVEPTTQPQGTPDEQEEENVPYHLQPIAIAVVPPEEQEDEGFNY